MGRSKIRESLLSKGYFPKELPPVFTTLDFGRFSREIIAEWESSKVFTIDKKGLGKINGGKTRRGSYQHKIKNSPEAEILSKPKRRYERRNLHITHPLPQALLAHEIDLNWLKIQRWILRQEYLLDEIIISDEHERSVKGINFTLHREKKNYIEGASDWIVKTDISRFYPTIYTHSIPWAAYGKNRVKAKMELYKGSLADRLDSLVRACNRNQTIGIPIGPETSRIIAEVISARMDNEFRVSGIDVRKDNVDRLQDDWLVGVETLEKAESVLSRISEIYRSYGLDINGSKTSIDHIVANKHESWLSEIGAFLSHRGGKLQGARLREFLRICLRLQASFPSEPVINYALSIVEGSQVSSADVRDMESFLLKAAVVAPNSIDRICRIILDLQHKTGGVSKKRVGERCVTLAERSMEKGHHYEVIWLLYILRGLNIKFASSKICELAESIQSASISLLLLDIKGRGALVSKLPTSAWESEITEESVLCDWTWLLAYEGFRHGWLEDKNELMKKPLFKPMAKRNVVFYDPSRNIKTSRSAIELRRDIRRRDQIELQKFFMEVRHLTINYEY